MIHVIVEHFLSGRVEAYFNEWVIEVRERASKYDGFISTKRAKVMNVPEKTVILLEWESEEALATWRSSRDHQEILKLLHPFQVKGSIVQFLEW